MPLMMQRQDLGREQFKVYDGQRYIGRVYQTPKDDWFWSLDLLLLEGKKSLDGRVATRTQALVQLRSAWADTVGRGQSTA
jgi:hypothetical protein